MDFICSQRLRSHSHSSRLRINSKDRSVQVILIWFKILLDYWNDLIEWVPISVCCWEMIISKMIISKMIPSKMISIYRGCLKEMLSSYLSKVNVFNSFGNWSALKKAVCRMFSNNNVLKWFLNHTHNSSSPHLSEEKNKFKKAATSWDHNAFSTIN